MGLSPRFFSFDENISKVKEILNNKFEMNQAKKSMFKIKSCFVLAGSSSKIVVAEVFLCID